ncbi:FUSC family protein [Paraburkholderia metrosideri]|uniref:Integral membrane bound transporter domain-containing protein n=1 Tax=Paraburkholderia metrosideri TaxID=580937 RepID=A0ABM8P2K1_9BURK|nr:FUSC family protein [Paraburkholderia metrosideri]CAD6554354.1 hypothetical protein LMG28140_05485 [Paraburkholderia metrosideri]
MRIADVLQTSRDAAFALGRECAAWKPSAERALLGVNAMLSVLLSVALAHMLHLADTWWVAISGFAVMQTHFAASLERALHRVLGTIIGALLGALVGPLIGAQPWFFIPVVGVIGGFTVYRANTGSASYAWVLGGVTAIMVTYEAHQLLAFRATASFALLRVIDVCVGVSACVAVSGALRLGQQWYRRHRPAQETASAAGVAGVAAQANQFSVESMRLTYAEAAVQAGFAIAICAAFAYMLKLPTLAQALVTIIAVLILPPSGIADLNKPIAVKMVQRIIGCLLAGAIGVALLPLLHGREIPCLVALSAGVWVGCHVQTGARGASYIGRQFTIAFIMVFVQDKGWSGDPGMAMSRLAGIVGGIVILAAVMLVANRLLFRSRVSI